MRNSLLPKSAAARRTLYIVLVLLLAFGLATALVLRALEENISFYRTPSELMASPPSERVYRIGGLVQPNSVSYEADGVTVRFMITDHKVSFPVLYKGLLPDLFKDGQGVVAEGIWQSNQTFAAKTLLARHDENYMPPEVAKALGVPADAAYGVQYQQKPQPNQPQPNLP